LVEAGQFLVPIGPRLLDEPRALGHVLVGRDLEERSGVGNAYA
jgi:hypothetical protein